MTVGEKISYYRKKANMSQEELGNQLFVTRQTVSQWENDQTVPTVENFMRLCEIFSLTMNDFFEQYENTPTGKMPEPNEKYSFEYTNSELDTAFAKIFAKNIFTYIIQMSVLAVYFMLGILLSREFIFYLSIVFIACATYNFVTLRIAYRQNCKKIKSRVLGRKYVYEIINEGLYVSVYSASGELVLYERISLTDLDKSWNTPSLFIFEHKQRRYIILKEHIGEGSKLKQLLCF